MRYFLLTLFIVALTCCLDQAIYGQADTTKKYTNYHAKYQKPKNYSIDNASVPLGMKIRLAFTRRAANREENKKIKNQDREEKRLAMGLKTNCLKKPEIKKASKTALNL